MGLDTTSGHVQRLVSLVTGGALISVGGRQGEGGLKGPRNSHMFGHKAGEGIAQQNWNSKGKRDGGGDLSDWGGPPACGNRLSTRLGKECGRISGSGLKKNDG